LNNTKFLQSKPWDWDFSADRIKFDTKESRDSIRAWLIELERNWYLVRKKFHNIKWYWDNEYVLYESPTTENTTQDSSMSESTATNKEINTKKEISKKEEYSPQFLEFWEAYWYKTGKKKSETAYKKINKETHDKIMKAIALQKKNRDEQVKVWIDPPFRKHPSSWINGECWNDEIITPKKKTNNFNQPVSESYNKL